MRAIEEEAKEPSAEAKPEPSPLWWLEPDPEAAFVRRVKRAIKKIEEVERVRRRNRSFSGWLERLPPEEVLLAGLLSLILIAGIAVGLLLWWRDSTGL